MASITIKNIPDDLYARLKESAAAHRRSVNSELIHYLDAALTPQVVPVQERLARIRHLRPDPGPYSATPDEIAEAIDQGRP